MASEVADLIKASRKVVIVSSGAIALGTARLGLRSRPKDMAWLQAAAAAGQSALMQRWEAALEPHGLTGAQVLLTHADLADRARTNNAQRALEALLEAGAVPIINENDAVSVEEISSATTISWPAWWCALVGADLLVLLSDVEGLLDERRACLRAQHRARSPRSRGRSRSGVGTGGMTSRSRPLTARRSRAPTS
jgi:glutamate 5-kinase